MLRRIVAAIIGAGVFFVSGALVMAAAVRPFFKDVPLSHPAYAAIVWAVERGFMQPSARTVNSFEPNAAVSRAQLAQTTQLLYSDLSARLDVLERKQGMHSSQPFPSSVATQDAADIRNAQRKADITVLVNAITQFATDHSGILPGGIAQREQEICSAASENDCNGFANLNSLVGTYIISIPRDPLTDPSMVGSAYSVVKDAVGHVTVKAPKAEKFVQISVTR